MFHETSVQQRNSLLQVTTLAALMDRFFLEKGLQSAE